jgi:hypothetical protein
MPAMVTKRVPDLAKVKKVSNGLLGFVVGFVLESSLEVCLGPDYRGNNDDFFATVHDSGVTILRFKRNPAFLLFKLRGCKDILVKDYPAGVIAIPLKPYTCKVNLNHGVTSVTVHQFPVIPAYGMTPEKLQGVTLLHDLYVSELDNRQAQILYVVLSRVLALAWLIFTQPLTMEYVRKFVPSVQVLQTVRDLMDRVFIPSYMTVDQAHVFDQWLRTQQRYCAQALRIHDDRAQLRRNYRRNVMDDLAPLATTAPQGPPGSGSSTSLSTATVAAQAASLRLSLSPGPVKRSRSARAAVTVANSEASGGHGSKEPPVKKKPAS